jgi:hypothetical protein
MGLLPFNIPVKRDDSPVVLARRPGPVTNSRRFLPIS